MNQSMKWNYECTFKNDILRAFIYLSKLSWKRQTKGLNAFYSQKYLTDTNFMNILYTSLSIFHGHVSTIVCNSGRESSIRESAWKNSRNEGRTQRRNRFLLPPRRYTFYFLVRCAGCRPICFWQPGPASMHHRTWTSPKRNKFQIRSLLLFALSSMRRVEPWAVCIGHDAKRGGIEGPFHFIQDPLSRMLHNPTIFYFLMEILRNIILSYGF